ncbi:restriction endonuclease [Haloterrigena sp. SYSU A558-1]|uniref:Restriction endonuclease n=1 Tax=Haloterrigena gelatinilytica TaxID=2741724 RepID=A0ABX2LEQ7_9EURY|nr:restriction endonuclease [Haloterrigena gelatinilytica]NUC74737.1 restriction endonuclease [Haloterrigena gelatinilytica]
MSSEEGELSDLDWRSYQKLVAGLHADEETRVETEYDYPIPGSGTKEIDVVVWDQSDHYEYTVLIECKFHDSPLSQSVVDSVNGYFQPSDADKAVIVSKSGFQSGAIERAEGTGVELLTLRQLIPDTDLPVDVLRYVHNNLEITNRHLEVLDMDVEGLDDDEDTEREEVPVVFNQTNSQLYTTDREPRGETLLERRNELEQSMEVGEHTEEFDDVALLINGTFFQLHSMEYRVTESTGTMEFTVDLLEDVDLLYRDELTGDEEYRSLSDALEAFQEHVEADS